MKKQDYKSPELKQYVFYTRKVIATSGSLGEGIGNGNEYDDDDWN